MTKPTDTNEPRQALSALRRWCPEGGTYQDLDDPVCGWEHGEKSFHTLRKRRMLICSTCQQGHFTKKEFDNHECYSAY